MTEKERKKIEQALFSENAQELVDKACKEILCNRIQWDKQPDRNLSFILQGIVKNMNFSLTYKIEDHKAKPAISSSNYNQVIGYGALAVLGLCSTASKNSWISLLGGLAASVGGYGICKQLYRSANKNSVITISSTPDKIGEMIDSVYESLTSFYNYRQLEGRHIKILLWFQNFYSANKSTDLARNISKLLEQYGYKFEDYSADRCADFDLHVGNVDAPVTTEPAIINEKGDAVCKGTAVIPKI